MTKTGRQPQFPAVFAAIACGGTGGHLFPGVAEGRELCRRGCEVTLLVSSKEIDRQAVAGVGDMQVVALPGIGFGLAKLPQFVRGFCQSYRLAGRLFQKQPPQFVLAMGGFTAAPPALAGKRAGRSNFPARSQQHPGPRQPLAGARDRRRVRLFSASRSATPHPSFGNHRR